MRFQFFSTQWKSDLTEMVKVGSVDFGLPVDLNYLRTNQISSDQSKEYVYFCQNHGSKKQIFTDELNTQD